MHYQELCQRSRGEGEFIVKSAMTLLSTQSPSSHELQADRSILMGSEYVSAFTYLQSVEDCGHWAHAMEQAM